MDLNPIGAAMNETLETSVFTGAKDRMDDGEQAGTRTRIAGATSS